MDQAITGLIGAVVGGSLTAGSNLTLEWIRNRRADGQALDERARSLREAVRLVDDELVSCIEVLAAAELKGQWPKPSELLSTDRWSTYAPMIARSDVAEGAWALLTDTYQTVREANGRILNADLNGREKLDEKALKYLQGVRSAIELGQQQLRPGPTAPANGD
jgi:hypothetical protein